MLIEGGQGQEAVELRVSGQELSTELPADTKGDLAPLGPQPHNAVNDLGSAGRARNEAERDRQRPLRALAAGGNHVVAIDTDRQELGGPSQGGLINPESALLPGAGKSMADSCFVVGCPRGAWCHR